MNYYSHHIGDFIRDTSRLSDSQSMAYLRLLWIYYETEQPIENDVDAVAFKIGANVSDVQQIFKHFFFLHDDGLWHQARCDKEILAFRDKSEKAKKSADARWANANAMRTHTDRKAKAQVSDANQEPVTSNQEPKTKNNKTTDLDYSSWPQMPSDQILEDWKSVRKQKRALITQTVINEFGKELFRAVAVGFTVDQCLTACITQNWQGFKAEWLQNRAQVLPMPAAAPRPTPTKNLRDVMEQQEAMSE